MNRPLETAAPRPQDGGAVAVFLRIVDAIALAAAYMAAACLVAMVLLVLGEILFGLLSRVIPSVPSGIHFAWEYSAYLMGCAFMFGGALSLRAGMQIRVELLLRAADGRFARPLEILAACVGAGFLVVLAWSLTAFAWQSWTSSQVSGDTLTPLWIPQGALAFATWIFALQGVARVFSAVLGLPLENEDFKVASATE
jgi:TRAP-type mannitol/chloroaromatic compound transport system permease small subunit